MADIEWDDDALVIAVSGSADQIRSITEQTAARANALSSGYRTGLYYRDHKKPPVGDTQPVYSHDVKTYGKGYPVGIVYTGNYAAMKDNHENNTLLKSRG